MFGRKTPARFLSYAKRAGKAFGIERGSALVGRFQAFGGDAVAVGISIVTNSCHLP